MIILRLERSKADKLFIILRPDRRKADKIFIVLRLYRSKTDKLLVVLRLYRSRSKAGKLLIIRYWRKSLQLLPDWLGVKS